VHIADRKLGTTATIVLPDTSQSRAFVDACLKDETMKRRIIAQSRFPDREVIVIGEMMDRLVIHKTITEHLALYLKNEQMEVVEEIEMARNLRWAIVRFKERTTQQVMMQHRFISYRGQNIPVLEAADRPKLVQIVVENLRRVNLKATEFVDSWIRATLKFDPVHVREAKSMKGWFAGHFVVLCATEENTRALLNIPPMSLPIPGQKDIIKMFTRQPAAQKTTDVEQPAE